MTDKSRIKIAAMVTALFLAGISSVGIALHKNQPATAGVTAPAALIQQPSTQIATHGEQEHEAHD